jgi:hypothetical protein
MKQGAVPSCDFVLMFTIIRVDDSFIQNARPPCARPQCAPTSDFSSGFPDGAYPLPSALDHDAGLPEAQDSTAEVVFSAEQWAALASAEHLCLGQVATTEKSNEITAISELLQLLDLHSAIVTIDAMGCQKTIAAKIIERGGDYVLTVKDNQPHLRTDGNGGAELPRSH